MSLGFAQRMISRILRSLHEIRRSFLLDSLLSDALLNASPCSRSIARLAVLPSAPSCLPRRNSGPQSRGHNSTAFVRQKNRLIKFPVLHSEACPAKPLQPYSHPLLALNTSHHYTFSQPRLYGHTTSVRIPTLCTSLGINGQRCKTLELTHGSRQPELLNSQFAASLSLGGFRCLKPRSRPI